MKPYPKPAPVRKHKKPRRKTERQELEQALDNVVRDIVKIRDHQVCVICSSTARPQAGHVFVRDRMGTRWDLRNVHCQCAACNLRHRFDEQPYTHWMLVHYGREVYDELYHLAEDNPYYKWSIPELQAELNRLLQIHQSLSRSNCRTDPSPT